LSSISYSIFWSLILVVGVPIALTVLASRSIYLVGRHYYYEKKKIRKEEFEKGDSGEKDNDKKVVDDDSSPELAVVVTGCDSGFGKEIALFAASKQVGYIVFACCLREESFDSFKLIPNVVPVKVDVTSDDDVNKLVEKVEEWIERKGEEDDEKDDGDDEEPEKQHLRPRRALHALVNNAGVGLGFVVDLTDMNVYRKVMEGRFRTNQFFFVACGYRAHLKFLLFFILIVNFFGVVRCCKAFLPILKRQALEKGAKGSKIVNLTSLAGICPGAYGGSAYSSSKHAAQGFSQSLRLEMAQFGVQVSTINPTFHSTPLVETMPSALEDFASELPKDRHEEYGQGENIRTTQLSFFWLGFYEFFGL